MRDYKLRFIRSEDLYKHVKETVEKYRFSISLDDFSENLIDPIKLTFDAKIYKKTIEEIVEIETLRQIDKSNTNHIGYFHQNIFRYIGKGWEVPEQGYDVINKDKQIFVEMKNKHNTMNSSSSQKTYMRMQHTLLHNPKATCMLVEVIARCSQNKPWVVSLDGEQQQHARIRRVSIDHFYHFVTGQDDAFKRLCETLPLVLDDVLAAAQQPNESNTVLKELSEQDTNILKSLFLLSFGEYLGFENFHV